MLKLAYKAAATDGDPIYPELVHKLGRVSDQNDGFSGAQFDLF
jgi:hypothetical protein